MAKKVIGKLRLAPYVPAWYDAVNDIHLVRPNHVEQEVFEDADLRPIMKGVHAGYIKFNEMVEDIKEEVESLKPQKIGLNMQAPEAPAKRKKRAKKVEQVEEQKVEEVTEEPKQEEVKEDK